MCRHVLWFTADVDYTAVSKAFTLAPSQSTVNVSIPIRDDDIALESNVTFTVAIVTYGDVIVLSNSTVTIVDNDHGEFSNNVMSAMWIITDN